jgi:polar amino acid transport system substrate-binding protein
MKLRKQKQLHGWYGSGYWRLILWALGLLSATCVQASCQLILGYNDEPIPPFIERSAPSAGAQGRVIQLVNQAATQLHCQVIWQPLPTLRVLHAAIHQQIDGALFYSWTEERSKALIYPQHQGTLDASRRLATLNYVLYRRQGAAVTWDGTRLKPAGCVVGFNSGWSIGNYLQEHAIANSAANSTEQNLKRLDKERICAYATLEEAGDAAIARFPGRFEKLPHPLSRKDYYLLFNPFYYQQHSHQVEQLWDQILQLRPTYFPIAPAKSK